MFSKKSITIILIIAFALVTFALQAAEYCSGTVKNYVGSPMEATVWLYAWTQEYGWLEVGSCDTNPSTGYYQICLNGRNTDWKIVAELANGHTLTKYQSNTGYSFTVNFVYWPQNNY